MFSKFVRKVPLMPLAIALGSTATVLALRALGWLTPGELWAYDRLFRQTSATCAAPISLVVLTESDIQKYGHPVNGLVMSELLATIQVSEPAAIAFDLYRDLPVEPGHDRLLTQLRADNVIAIERAGKFPISPPPGVKQFGAADVVSDPPTGQIRRALYALGRPIHPSLGLRTAALYTGTPWQDLLEAAKPFRLWPEDGPYHDADTGGYQFLLNWQSCRFEIYSFANILDEGRQLPPGQIVVIGQEAESVKDIVGSPFGRISGAENHAHVIAQFLDLESGNATPVRFPLQGPIALGLLLYSLAHVGSIWALHKRHYLVVGAAILLLSVAFGGAAVLVYFTAFESYILWLPVIPALIVLGLNLLAMTYAVTFVRLREQARALQATVAQQTAARLEERNLVEVGDWARGIFHDLRSPLSRLEGYIEFLGTQLDADALDRDKLKQCHAALARQIEASYSIVDTISQVLNLRREPGRNGNTDPIKAAIELGLNIVRTKYESPTDLHLRYRCEIAEPLPKIQADRGLILRLVLNLVENANEAIRRKGAVEPGFKGEITVRALEEDDRFWLEVQDNGPGLPPDVQAAFDAWDRTHWERLQLPTPGIGLYTVARIVVKEAGTFWVKSSPDSGTMFGISLPLAY